MEIDDMIDILYDGSKEQIEQILNKYKISYNYSKKTMNFRVTSRETLETIVGNKSHYEPNCVKYFGDEFK